MAQSEIVTFTPYLGLVVYGDPERSRHYIQVHNIEKNNWGEGKPFKREDLAHLAQAIKSEQVSALKLGGLIPDNLLYFQPGVAGSKFMWYIEPSIKHINFTKEVKIPSRNYHIPGLIFAVSNKTLYVFAYKGSKKPNEKTELYHAPFFNVYEGGNVCMGTVSEARMKSVLNEEMDRWERRFFGGNFTSAHGERNRIVKGFTFKSVYMQARKKFPEKCLMKTKHKSLETFLNTFMQERKGYED